MQLYNSSVIDSYVKMLAKKYPHANTDKILKHASMEPYEVADQGHWFTQKQVDLFYEMAVKESGSETIAREAGKYAASPDALGILRHYILGMMSPTTLFSLIEKTAEKLTRSADYKSRQTGTNEIELLVTPHKGIEEKPFQCENRLGFIEAALTILNHESLTIEHQECLFKGNSSCRYLIRWKPNRSAILGKIRTAAAITTLSAITGTAIFYPDFIGGTAAATTIAFLIFCIYVEFVKNLDLKIGLEFFSETAEKLVEQTNINYRNSQLANEIGLAISEKTNLDTLFETIPDILKNRLDYQRGLILIYNKEKNTLKSQSAYGYNNRELKILEKATFNLNNASSRGAFVVSFKEKRPLLINNINDIEDNLSKRSFELAKSLGVTGFICCPIICDGNALGLIVLENLRSGRPLLQSDLSQIMGIAPVIGSAIRNAELLENKENLFKSTLKTLAASIDARDPLTAGHSEKVTEYALGICEEIEIDQEYREVVRVAALLHDYGKIGVPDSILKKPGKLSPAERDAVKAHALKTREILEQITFEGAFKEVPAIAAAHHEKLDGSGYPMGLKGDEIPLGAKIIGVADFFEAITSKRHYREPMPVAAAFQLLRAESKAHFDPEIVEAFFNWYRRNFAEGRLPADERRRLRIPYKTSVVLSINGQHRLGQSVDLSTSGAYISSTGGAQEGDIMDVAFTLPSDKGGKVVAKGRVAWTNPVSEMKKPTFPAGFGVEFVEFREQSNLCLQGFLTDTIRSDHVWAT